MTIETIYLKGSHGSVVPVEISNSGKEPTVIMASAENDKIATGPFKRQLERLYPGRTFNVWYEQGYVMAYSPILKETKDAGAATGDVKRCHH